MHLKNSSQLFEVGRRLATAIILSAFFMTGGAAATMLTVDYDFNAPEVEILDGQARVGMEGAMSLGDPGQPVLPRVGATILLPPGERISSIDLIPGERVILEGTWRVEVGQSQYPLSQEAYNGPDAPDAAIYGSDIPFPGRLHDDPVSGFYRGHRIANLTIHPMEYLPASGQLSYIRNCQVRIFTEPDASAMEQTRAMIRHDASTLGRIEGMVDNLDLLSSYAQVERNHQSRALDAADAYKYVIVTSDAYSPYLGDLVEFQTQRGLKAGVFLKDWINAEYTGSDEQMRIRNFIIDAYATWDTDYVLLVGDSGPTDGIPHRGMYALAYGTTETNLPSDLYYACLDGNWNADGDGYYGETNDSPDMYHELGVGRAAVSSPTEIQNWIVKQIRYQAAPVVGECDEAIMVGELLWSEPTWGGDYKDEIKFGASTHGYTTVGFPDNMNVDTLYDREGTWNANTLIGIMNNGLNILNHLGHADYTYMMKFYNSDVQDFTNDGINHSYNFVYSQGCMCGGFDYDSISENLNNDVHGPVALITNSRYGWGQHESTDGSSQYFDREFFDAMFDEEIYALADVNNDSKEDVLWNIGYGANRWCYYELNLFGDPAMHLWTGEPGTLQASLPGVVFIGAPDMEIAVSELGVPIANARVCIYTDDYAVYDSGTTNAYGIVTLHPGAVEPGTLHVKVVAHDYLEYSADVPILPPAGPFLVFDESVVLDEDGDDDGMLDEGEVVGMAITLENVGVDPTTGVSATLSTDDDFITVIEGERDYPDIPAGGMGACLLPFEIQVAGDVPDEHVIQFTVDAHSNEGAWSANFFLGAQAPILSCCGYTVVDLPGGNGSGTADAGETISLMLDIHNSGHSDAESLVGVINCWDINVAILDGAGACPMVPVGGEGMMSEFQVEIMPGCPEPATIDFFFSASNGDFAADMSFALPVGGWFDDFEDDRGWTVGYAGDNASTGIWTRVDPIGTSYDSEACQTEDDHTPAPGTKCFVTGQGSAGGSAGENDVDGGKTTLLTPVFGLEGATSAELSYWRWYTNDLGNNPGQDYWKVDVTSDGSTWVSLENTNVSNNTWVEMSFELADYINFTDQVQVRFVADDATDASLVEAAIDDVLLNAFIPIITSTDEGIVPTLLELGRNFPNPFNPKTTLSFALPVSGKVDLAVYDVRGRRVATLISGIMEAGYHETDWLGVDEGGHPVASGIYFSRLSFGKEVMTEKMLMLK